MNLEVIIEKTDDSVVIPLDTDNGTLQTRNDGIYLNGELHLWEEIMIVTITNREVMDKLKRGNNDTK